MPCSRAKPARVVVKWQGHEELLESLFKGFGRVLQPRGTLYAAEAKNLLDKLWCAWQSSRKVSHISVYADLCHGTVPLTCHICHTLRRSNALAGVEQDWDIISTLGGQS